MADLWDTNQKQPHHLYQWNHTYSFFNHAIFQIQIQSSMMQKIKAIIFDLGNVLIDWNPKYVFDKLIEDEERRKHFFENICTPDWNEEQDAGRPIKQATEELIAKHPDWKEAIEAFYGRWIEMLGGPISDTVEILRSLKEKRQYKLYALTNWSAETFPKSKIIALIFCIIDDCI